MECPICFEQIGQNFTILQCSHSFHSHCIHVWSDKNNSCPCCRQIIYTKQAEIILRDPPVINRIRILPI